MSSPPVRADPAAVAPPNFLKHFTVQPLAIDMRAAKMVAMQTSEASVGKRAPDFELPCTDGNTRGIVRLSDFTESWLLLVFYPRDFSLVCPTELTALSRRIEEFRARSCAVLGISTDSIETHERWILSPTTQGGLGGLTFSLASDLDGMVSRSYGVYLEPQRLALRGLFIVDPNGVLQYQVVHNLSVGRRVDEVLRVLAALESGGMCPEDWCVDCQTLDPTEVLGPGSRLGHYHIEGKLGEGSFAGVFRARDVVLDRTVALKVFKPRTVGGASDSLTEARLAASLNHPNICTVFAIENSDGVPVIAMEFVDGQPLSTLLQQGALPVEQVASITRQLASGLAAAHSQRIIHGDLKPANILVTKNGVVKITDFGLSRRMRAIADAATVTWDGASGKIAGTPSYMSPEQTVGEAATPASDVFSLGAVLYEMLTGRQAFAGDNILQVLNQIREVKPERLAIAAPEPFSTILRHSLRAAPPSSRMTMAQIVDLLQ